MLQQTPGGEGPLTDRTAFLSRNSAMPSPHTNPDRRVARTELSLHRALNSLVLEKGYRETTIHDILTRAKVGRSTFYAHHGGKEGLLLHGLHHLQDALRKPTRDSADRSPAPILGFSVTFFTHVYEHRDTLQALRKGESGPLVLAKIKRILLQVVRSELGGPQMTWRSKRVPLGAMVQVTTEVLFTVLWWWLDERPELSPAQADEIFRRLALPALVANGFAEAPTD